MKGRKPKPIAQQIAEGDPRQRGKRKLEQKLAAEPKAARGLPSCPRHLKGRARVAWNFWSEELAAMNLDRRPDAMVLEGACIGYARAVEADLMIAKEGPIVRHRTADPVTREPFERVKAHPAVSISRGAWAQVRAFCTEFGLSPASRTRLSIEKPDDGEDDFMAILMQPREPRVPIPN
jgi:P27 family predicted phage terminase small subunit